MTSARWPDNAGQRLFAWPGRENLRVTGTLASAFVIFWIIVYGGSSWLTGLHSIRLSVHMEWDLLVPFVPEVAVLYISLIPMMFLSLFVFRTWEGLVPLLVVLVVETLIGGACFLLLPVVQAFPESAAAGPLSGIFHLADAINLEFNYLPSLHVAYAFTTALAIGTRSAPFGKGVFLVWATGIAISTMLLHQHYFVDIIAGIALAGLTMRWLYDRASSPPFLRIVRAEMICIGEIYRFSRRHRRYLVVAIIIYRYSLFRWREMRVIRVGFCLLQHIDDILDGDRPCPGEPADVADEILGQMEEGVFGESPLACLARCMWEETGRFQTEYDNPRSDVLTLIRLMQRDRFRVRDKLLLSRNELIEHHRQTFYYAVNLMLTLGGAEIRARDAPDLIEAFGWCSTMRDLQEDIEKGLVNLPASVIDAARSQGLDTIEYASVVKAPVVKEWMRDQYRRATQHLDRFEHELVRLQGKRGVAILRLFHRSIRRFAVRASKRYGWQPAN
jgi:membrane-associated phospholipid phosphatase/phytoene/squalene synthetase